MSPRLCWAFACVMAGGCGPLPEGTQPETSTATETPPEPPTGGSEFADLLDISGVPEATDDRRPDVTFDLGAWQGWGLADEVALGFSGPRLLGDDRWASPRLLRLVVDGIDGPVRRTWTPGTLHQTQGRPGAHVELTLRWADARWVVHEARGPGLAGDWIFEGRTFPGAEIRVADDRVVVERADGSALIVLPLTEAIVRGSADGFEIAPSGPTAPSDVLRVAVGYRVDETDAELERVPRKHLAAQTRELAMRTSARWVDWTRRATTRVDGNRIDAPEDRRLAAKALVTLIANWRVPYGELRDHGLFPSWNQTSFHGLWSWDSWKHAAALADVAPELARRQIQAMFARQGKDGMIPDVVYRVSAEDNWRDTKPPLAAWAVHAVWRASHREDPDTASAWLASMLPRLERYHQWWFEHRDHDGDGLCEYGSTDGTLQAAAWESGMDNAVRFDGASMVANESGQWSMDRESVDLSAYLAFEKRILSELWSAMGDPARSESYANDASAMEATIRTTFFSQDRGWFLDRKLDGQHATALGPEGWTPLFTGAAAATQADAVRKVLMDPAHFRTTAPFPTLDASHPDFEPDRGYWRGPVWLDQAYFALAGLRRYGFEEDARALQSQLLAALEGLRGSAPIRETYDPRTGAGQNARHFSWSAAHLLMMLRGQWN